MACLLHTQTHMISCEGITFSIFRSCCDKTKDVEVSFRTNYKRTKENHNKIV